MGVQPITNEHHGSEAGGTFLAINLPFDPFGDDICHPFMVIVFNHIGDILWHFIQFYGILWHFIQFYGILFHFMAFYCISWHWVCHIRQRNMPNSSGSGNRLTIDEEVWHQIFQDRFCRVAECKICRLNVDQEG